MRILAFVLILLTAPVSAKTIDITSHACAQMIDEGMYSGPGFTGHSQKIDQVKGCGFRYWTANTYQEAAITLHDDVYGAVKSVVKNMNGFRFDVISASVFAWSHAFYQDAAGNLSLDVPNFLINAGVYGYRNGQIVTSLEFFERGFNPGKEPMLFDSSFTDLDMLIFRMFVPEGARIAYDGEGMSLQESAGVWCWNEYCGGVGVNNLLVSVADNAPASVPLPASLPLLMAALFSISQLRRRARKSLLAKRIAAS